MMLHDVFFNITATKFNNPEYVLAICTPKVIINLLLFVFRPRQMKMHTLYIKSLQAHGTTGVSAVQCSGCIHGVHGIYARIVDWVN